MQVAGRWLQEWRWLPGMASQVSSGTPGKAHDFSGSRHQAPLRKCNRRFPGGESLHPVIRGGTSRHQAGVGIDLRDGSWPSAKPLQLPAREEAAASQAGGQGPIHIPCPSVHSALPPAPATGNPAYLPHEVVVLADVHMLRSDDPASEGAHLGAGLDPRLGEDAEALAGD